MTGCLGIQKAGNVRPKSEILFTIIVLATEMANRNEIKFWADPLEHSGSRPVAEWIELSSQHDHPWGLWQTGLLLLSDASRESEGLEYIRRAAEMSFAPAEFSLGVSYSSGRGVKTDKRLAIYWFERSAGHGFAAAAYNVGHFAENGVVGQPDKAKAAMWYRIASNMGDSDAEVALGNLCADFLRVNPSEKEDKWPFFWYRLAARHGNLDGIYNLALCYKLGTGTKKNRTRWLRLIQKSAKLGHEKSVRAKRKEDKSTSEKR